MTLQCESQQLATSSVGMGRMVPSDGTFKNVIIIYLFVIPTRYKDNLNLLIKPKFRPHYIIAILFTSDEQSTVLYMIVY